MLTGKLKKHFDNWNKGNFFGECYVEPTNIEFHFDDIDEFLQHQVIIQYLDRAGFYISVEPHLGGGAEVFFSKVFYRHPENFVDTWDDVENEGYDPKIFYFSDRQSATKAAIEQANKIYNER